MLVRDREGGIIDAFEWATLELETRKKNETSHIYVQLLPLIQNRFEIHTPQETPERQTECKQTHIPGR